MTRRRRIAEAHGFKAPVNKSFAVKPSRLEQPKKTPPPVAKKKPAQPLREPPVPSGHAEIKETAVNHAAETHVSVAHRVSMIMHHFAPAIAVVLLGAGLTVQGADRDPGGQMNMYVADPLRSLQRIERVYDD